LQVAAFFVYISISGKFLTRVREGFPLSGKFAAGVKHPFPGSLKSCCRGAGSFQEGWFADFSCRI